MVERYRRWFEYEKDAHEKVLVSLDTVPAAAREDEAFRKAIALFAHILAGRWIWLYRLGHAETPQTDFFPNDVPLHELPSRVEAMNQAWSDYLAALDETELARICEYRTSQGDLFRNAVEDILTQLFGHSLYHRGHIASLVKSAGGTAAATDFIFWTRQPLQD